MTAASKICRHGVSDVDATYLVALDEPAWRLTKNEIWAN